MTALPAAGNVEAPVWRLILRLAINSLFWSSGFVFMKMLTGDVSPVGLSAARATVAASALGLWFLARRENPRPQRHELVPWAVLGTLNGWLPNILTAFALTQITAASSAMIQASGPLMVAVMAHFAFVEERLTPGRIGGVCLGFVGMALLIGPAAFVEGGASMLGALAMTGVAFCYALGGIYARRLRGFESRRMALGQQMASATVALPLVLALEGSAALASFAAHPWALIALGTLSTAVPITIFMGTLVRHGPTKAAMVGYLMPVFAAVLAVVFLGESVGLREIAGGAVILAGVWLVSASKR